MKYYKVSDVIYFLLPYNRSVPEKNDTDRIIDLVKYIYLFFCLLLLLKFNFLYIDT